MPFSFLLLSTLLAILTPSDWQSLSFERVPANEVSFQDGSLEIKVTESASPLVNVFSRRQAIRAILDKGSVSGQWQLPTMESWDKSPDDALLRIGLIENGTRRLNALESMAAPSWIKEIEMQSQGISDGIGKIHCFHLMPDEKWIGETRENPNSAIFLETALTAPSEDGRFEMVIELDVPVDTVGLWLLADGDDSQAAFSLEVESLEVEVAP